MLPIELGLWALVFTTGVGILRAECHRGRPKGWWDEATTTFGLLLVIAAVIAFTATVSDRLF